MSQSLPQPADRDELLDRLVDRALAEKLGGETPPDLSSAIFARAAASTESISTPTETAMNGATEPTKRRRYWAPLAVAATLLIAAAILVLPAIRPPRQSLADRQSTASTRGLAAGVGVAPKPAQGKELLGLETNQGVESPTMEDETITSPALASKVRDWQLTQEGREKSLADSSSTGKAESATGGAQVVDGLAALAGGGAPADGYQRQDWTERGGRRKTVEAAPGGAIDADLAFTAPASMPLDTVAVAVPENPLIESLKMMVTPHIIVQDGEGAVQLHDSLGEVAKDSGAHFYRTPGQDGAALASAATLTDLTTAAPIAPEMESSPRYSESGLGNGPQAGGDRYARIEENPFKAISPATTDNRLSTFSIDVDTASYANVRQFLLASRTLPPPDAVRIEELVNYFDYGYSAPTGDVPFASNVEVAACPWKPEHQLVRVGIKGREMDRSRRPKSNLVFLIDVSGSMDEPNKLPLLVEGMKLLTRELGENDRVAIVVYASTEGLVLESTRGTEQATILDALNRLSAGGSTAGGAGIQLAYKVAQENFIKDGVNRVILCTDGDFNVGVTSPAELERMAETNAKETGVFLTVLGFGRGNLNDAMMEQIADKGNGNYHYVDTRAEAKKVLVEEMVGTLVTIAKDVKIQIEFNPAKVAGYRLIGYENRVMAAEDFNDDKKDAGEIGAGHTVTALYEVVPSTVKFDAASVDELRYGSANPPQNGAVASATSENGADADGGKTAPASDELLTLKIRYKAPDGDVSEKLEFPITDNEQPFAKASEDFKFASAVASFGMLLRGSEHKGNATYAAVAEIADAASKAGDKHGYRAEFVEMVKAATEFAGE